MSIDVLLVGCGELGTAIGLRLAARGHRVAGLRRQADRVPPPLLGVAADLTHTVPDLPDLDLAYLVVALTARPRTEASYRATYVDGMSRALDAIHARGQTPRRAILVSSTGVYGDLSPDELTDETTPATPDDPPSQALLDAEHVFRRRLPHGIVLRPSGLYGGASTRLIDQVLRGDISDPHRWTNRLHREDAAAAVEHLLTMESEPDALYVATDDEPVQLGAVAAHLAPRLGAPAPPPADPALGHGKRLSNARLRSTGWAPRYATFREGYAAQLS